MEYPKIETLYNRGPDHFVTDEIRCPEFNQINWWLVTEKIDGTNIRISLEPTEILEPVGWQVRFGGRTDAAQIPTFLLAYLQETFTVGKMSLLWRGRSGCAFCGGSGWVITVDAAVYGCNQAVATKRCSCVESYPITLYGEGYGERIQKGGGNYRKGVSFRLFDVLVDGRWWLDWAGVRDVAEKLELKTVPVVYTGKADVGQITYAVRAGFPSSTAREDRGFTPDSHAVPAEGVVARTDPYLFDKFGRPLRFKLKTKDFRRE